MNNIGKESKISNRYKPIVELKTPLDRHLKEHSFGQKSPILDNHNTVCIGTVLIRIARKIGKSFIINSY